jgi:hypothetical protein
MDAEGVIVLKNPPGLTASKPLDFLNRPQPEFIDGTKKFVLGGFGAMGHPTSFHHPDIRFVRRYLFNHVAPTLFKLFPGKKVALMMDRIAQRWEGDSISGETWHRDICDHKRPEDIILGGWVNLDTDQNQYFHCVPGTHKDKTGAKGFAKLKDPSEYKPLEKIYTIKPNEMILFHQNLVHRIKPGKIKKNSQRIFFGWLITDLDTPIFDYTPFIKDQSPPPIPSGQTPPMYAKLHWVNHKQKLFDFSKGVHSKLKNPNRSGTVYQFCPSLKSLGLPMWPEYSEEDLQVFKPNRELPPFSIR